MESPIVRKRLSKRVSKRVFLFKSFAYLRALLIKAHKIAWRIDALCVPLMNGSAERGAVCQC